VRSLRGGLKPRLSKRRVTKQHKFGRRRRSTRSADVRSWRLHTRTHLSEADLARRVNPVVRGSLGGPGLSLDVA
jgi:hypothetical protein